MIEIETQVVKDKFGKEKPGVLLQLPRGWVVLRPDDARELAAMLTMTAEDADNG